MSWKDYEEAFVRVAAPAGELVIAAAPLGMHDSGFPDPAGRPIHILTSHNPEGRPQPASANEVAHERLLTEVHARGIEHWPAAGGDPAWEHVEEGLALIGITEADAVELAQQFGQEAIYAWSPEAWEIVAADRSRRTSLGWQLLHDKALPRA